MPIYEYQCEEHGNFSYQTEISKRNDDYFCPTCGSVTKRIISAPSLSIMNDNNRQAWARNEKSAHEPQHKKKHVCSSSCNHSHDNKNSGNFMQSPAKGRPWMLGH
jgi:putative FmdB family regulatory protein